MARIRLRYVPRLPNYDYNKIIKSCVIGVSVCLIIIVALGILLGIPKEPDPNEKFLKFYNESEFQVDEARCKIPTIKPTSIKELKIKRTKLQPCKNIPMLTTVDSTRHPKDPLVITLHADLLSQYNVNSQETVNCSYRAVRRKPFSDSETYLSNILGYFNNEIIIDNTLEHIFVSCLSAGKEFYKNVHAVVKEKEIFNERQKAKNVRKKKPYKVLMIGFDKMSRNNFGRGMPHTYNFFKGDEWFEFSGYTRLSNETFGNVFPILTGQSANQRHKKCNPKSNDFLDNCDFIWKKFRESGYITAFAEDQKNQSTWHVHHKGFLHQPTDYYFRPFVVEAEKNLFMRNKGDLGFCLGTTLYLDNIFVYAMKVIDIHVNDPYFGFFYVNSMSDKQLSTSPILDARISDSVFKYIQQRSESDLILIYFGDMGLRFEESSMGFYEERLPFLSIRLPMEFQKDHPELVGHLRDNTKRLTTPFDLHITLKHIINLSIGRRKYQKEAVGCAGCKSLFDKIPLVRSCLDAEIPAHSCPCSLVDVPPSRIVARHAAEYAVKVLNQNLNKKCSRLKLVEVITSSYQRTAPWNMNYIVSFSVSPSKAKFEAVLSRKFSSVFSLTPKFELIQEIDHINAEKEPIICVTTSSKSNSRRMEEDDEDEEGGGYYDLLSDNETFFESE